MRLSSCKFFIDENIPAGIITFLRDKGYDVISVSEKNLFGTSDLELIRLAQKEQRIILTQDSDFGKIVYSSKIEYTGIIYIRPGHIDTEFHIKSLNALLGDSTDLIVPFIIVAENRGETIKLRIRDNLKIQF